MLIQICMWIFSVEGVTTYQVTYENGSDAQVVVSNDTTAVISSLEPDTNYVVTVNVTDSDGKTFTGTKSFTTGKVTFHLLRCKLVFVISNIGKLQHRCVEKVAKFTCF